MSLGLGELWYIRLPTRVAVKYPGYSKTVYIRNGSWSIPAFFLYNNGINEMPSLVLYHNL